MAKPKTIYRCTECGYESAKWNGKCPSCGAWNTLEEDVPLPAQAVGNSRRKPVDLSDKIQELDEVDTTADVRYHTGVGELDRVLGGVRLDIEGTELDGSQRRTTNFCIL